MTQKEWINTMAPLAQKAQKRFGYLASVLIAQSCLENGYGMDSSCEVLTSVNNVLGMKRELLNDSWQSSYWKGAYITKRTPEWNSSGVYYKKDDFRKYDSLQDCFYDYCQFMRDARYSPGGSYKYRDVLSIRDPETLIGTVAGRGYCTDPSYPESIMRIIKEHDLCQFDQSVTVIRTVRSILSQAGKTLVDLIAANRDEVPEHDANSHKYLAIHYLGVDNADNPYLYGGGYGGHFYVPIFGRKAYQAALVTDKIWHVAANSKNGYKYIHPDARNDNTIGIEIGTFRDSQGRWMYTNDAQEMAAYLAAAIMTVYQIPQSHLLRHGDITTKCCPAPLMPASRGGYEGEGSNWTWEAFKARVNLLMEEMGEDIPSAIQIGDAGDAVKDLQEDLIRIGFSCGKAGTDGRFGQDTEDAVKAFQTVAELAVDGVVGPDTRRALDVALVQIWLKKLLKIDIIVDGQYGPKTKKALVIALQKCLIEIYAQKIVLDGSFGPETKTSCRTIQRGDKGLLVSILQAVLLVHGIHDSKIDASFGDGTEKGVKAFQTRSGIAVDGVAGPDTFEKLFTEEA